MLFLALCNGEEGMQSSIVREAFHNGRNGIEAVSQLMKHFELTNMGCKIYERIAEFHTTSLGPGEDPDAVCYKLQDLSRQANALGEKLSEIDIARRLTVMMEEEY